MVGSNLTRTGLAGCGGLLRDEHGNWLAGFARRIGTTTSLPTLWLSYGALEMVYHYATIFNIPSLIVDLGAKAIIDIFQNPNYENNIISTILDDSRQLMGLFHQIQFKHCYR